MVVPAVFIAMAKEALKNPRRKDTLALEKITTESSNSLRNASHKH